MAEASDPAPYAQLTSAVRAYGEAAMENFLRCRAFGYAVVEGLAGYLQAPEGRVFLVPPQGPFHPKKTYGDRAFSYNPDVPIRLEPVVFGVCVVVPNAEDSGSLWIRTHIRVDIKDDQFEAFVGHRPRVRLPLAFEGQLAPVYEALMAELMSVFRRELADYGDARYQNQLGFVPTLPDD